MLAVWRLHGDHDADVRRSQAVGLGTIDVKLRLVKEGDEARTSSGKYRWGERWIRSSGTKLLEIADKTPVTKALAPGVAIQNYIRLTIGTSIHPAR